MLTRGRWAPYLCSGAHVGVRWWLSLQEDDVWWQSCPKHTSKVRVRNLLKLKQSLAHAATVQNPVLCCHKFSVISLTLVWIVCAARLPFLPVGNCVSLLLLHWDSPALGAGNAGALLICQNDMSCSQKKVWFQHLSKKWSCSTKEFTWLLWKKLSAGLWHTRHKLNHN